VRAGLLQPDPVNSGSRGGLSASGLSDDLRTAVVLFPVERVSGVRLRFQVMLDFDVEQAHEIP
jgi:hypothetical protein